MKRNDLSRCTWDNRCHPSPCTSDKSPCSTSLNEPVAPITRGTYDLVLLQESLQQPSEQQSLYTSRRRDISACYAISLHAVLSLFAHLATRRPRAISPCMKSPTRRHRSSDKPIGRHRPIATHQIDRYIEALRYLEPYHHFKYATIPWLHYLCRAKVEYSVFRKYLGYLREAPNHYIGYPVQQLASPNTPYKTVVYELAERGLNELINRGITPKRYSPDPEAKPPKSKRNHAFALHRSNSYYHEIIVDLGYYAPLHHLTRTDQSLRLLDFAQLLAHPNVPKATRESRDPLLVQLQYEQTRFDGTPHLIIRTREDGVEYPLGIPGIQVDRGTERFEQVEKHIKHAIEFVEGRHYERHWGFDNCLVPFLFTKEVRKNRAMQFIRQERGKCPFILCQTIPDFGLLPHFPKPQHYDRAYQFKDGEWVPPDNIHVFTNPWQRVGFPDFYLNTFSEESTK